MKGWVYVLSNESMPGLVKVGYTQKDPESRAKELSGDTGVPSPFVVEYEILLENPRGAEQEIHRILRSKRHNRDREFFECTTEEAVITIKESFGGEAKFEQYHKLEKKKIEEAIRQKEEERIAEQKRMEAEAKLLEEQRQRELKEEAEKLEAEKRDAEVRRQKATEEKKKEKREYFNKHKLLIYVFSAGSLILMAISLYFYVYSEWYKSECLSTEAKVLSHFYSPTTRGQHVDYEFFVGDVRYTGGVKLDQSSAPNETVTIFYLPSNPTKNKGKLERGDTLLYVAAFWFFIFIIFRYVRIW